MEVADRTLFSNWTRLSLVLQPVSEAQVAVHVNVRNSFCRLVLLLLDEMLVALTVWIGSSAFAL
jgi:hypothetical protein